MHKNNSSNTLSGDLLGGVAAMLVALPSAVAFGLIVYAPLGSTYSGIAVIAGILGTIAIGLTAPIFGGTNRLVSAPCAPAAAVLSVFVAELVKKGTIPMDLIPVYISAITLFTGLFQILIGKIGGGTFIKYIPFPVVAGFSGGVGVLIFIGQLPKFLGLQKGVTLGQGLLNITAWKWESVVIGTVTIAMMLISTRFLKSIPAAIKALLSGIATYFAIALFNPALLHIEHNPFIIGEISASGSDLFHAVGSRWSSATLLNMNSLLSLLVPVLTLSVLLSIDTLKTSLVLDSLTFSRHNSNKELFGQGIGNVSSALFCGIPGAGSTGPTLVNFNSGGKTRLSGFFVGVSALLVLVLFGKLFAWIPLSALAGILLVVGYRMVDVKRFLLLKSKSTVFDFFVIFSVVIAALAFSLIWAAGVGIALAIFLFLKEQINTSVIRREVFGNQIFSKKLRTAAETNVLEDKGSQTIILELQGQLFFGTTDQLYVHLEPYYSVRKYFIIDIRRVQSIDYTAINMLKQIYARINDNGGFVIFTSLPLTLSNGQNVKAYFDVLGLLEKDNLKIIAERDAALQWVEDKILADEKLIVADDHRQLELSEFDLFSTFTPETINLFSECIVEKSFNPGELIFRLGEAGDEVYFLRNGIIDIELPIAGGKQLHVLTIGKGGIFGEIAFIDKITRSADAISMGHTSLYILSKSRFEPLLEKYPAVAYGFVEQLTKLIALRLRQSNKELIALQEN